MQHNSIVKGLVGMAAALALQVMPVSAQDFPSKPIKVTIPITPGSIADVALRKLGEYMERKHGQTWIVENKPGGNMIPGHTSCAQAKPDGYDLCFVASGGLIYAPQMAKVPYDTVSSFKPIGNVFYVIEGVSVNGKVPAKSMAELRDVAKSDPQYRKFGTLGPAATNELYRRWLNDEWGTEFDGVPYKGGSEVAVALLRGDITVSRIGMGNMVSHLKSGEIRVLAQSVKSPLLPDVPTLEEAGLGGYGGGKSWWGLAAPAGTPDDVVNKLNGWINEALADPDIRKFMIEGYLDPAPGTSAAFAETIKVDYERVGELIKKYGLVAGN